MDGELRVPVRQFRQDLRSWLDAAAGGETVIVERDGRPVAQVLAYDAPVAPAPDRSSKPAAASRPAVSVQVDNRALAETLEDLGEALGGSFRRVTSPIGDTNLQREGTHRRLASRTAQRVARDLNVPVPRVAWISQEARSDDFEALAGFAIPHLHTICLDRHVGELDTDAKRAGDYDRGVRQIRHVTAHEIYHLFDASASEAECDAFADLYSGGTRPAAADSSRSGPACDQFVAWWGSGRGWRGFQTEFGA